jgi:flagellar hook protein FlgE
MLKSLYSGVSGMKGFQSKLDVIGNNIANVNTVGFKKSRIMFQDIISQNLTGATAPTNQSGGINPQQIGLGSKIGAIDTLHTPGSPMTSGVGTDLAIDGDAYFVVRQTQDGGNLLTKAGNFTRDGEGNLVNANGFFVQGVVTDAAGVASPVNINISEDQVAPPEDPTQGPMKFTSYSIDARGYINVVREDGESGKLARNPGGQYYMSTTDGPETISIATTVLDNPGALKKIGGTLFEETLNVGFSDFGRIEDNSGGQINSGILEMSNVDLTEEFTELIVAQRGFQANARTITTSDSILEEVVNLKR